MFENPALRRAENPKGKFDERRERAVDWTALVSLKEPTTEKDISRQRTGASVQFFVLAAAFLVVLLAMYFWRPWKANPPAPPLRIMTNGPNAQPTTTIVPTP